MIGILGGSFDPPHLGHLEIAKYALKTLNLSQVIFIPAKHSPLKLAEPHASDGERLAMLRLLCAGDPTLSISTIELERGGISYTVDTLRTLHNSYPNTQLAFIVGMDSLLSLYKWKSPLEIINLCRFVTIKRPGIAIPQSLNLPKSAETTLFNNIFEGPNLNISSTQIRSKITSKEPFEDLTGSAIASFIKSNSLYLQGENNGTKR